ncbi:MULTISPECIES: hypothetical protein [Novosphingobium]|jgi:hypothetical protein|uniref:hypothetical protein n=1 Tax=Novosphingobium TaxID=165696 RepID=UPI000830C047|nr:MULTISPECIES: hypothetical protein [Novosphingobium]
MGIKDFLEEAAGAFAADKALEAVDPDAGLLAKGVAAVAGFEGVKAVKEHFDGEQAETDQSATDQDWSDQPAPDESQDN